MHSNYLSTQRLKISKSLSFGQVKARELRGKKREELEQQLDTLKQVFRLKSIQRLKSLII